MSRFVQLAVLQALACIGSERQHRSNVCQPGKLARKHWRQSMNNLLQDSVCFVDGYRLAVQAAADKLLQLSASAN